jgi:hypothetical protein
MTTPKSAIHDNTLMVHLTDEEHTLLELFAAEQGIKDLAQAIHAMIHELVRLHDELWDKQFAASEDVLNQLSQCFLAQYRAGLLRILILIPMPICNEVPGNAKFP